MTLNSNEKQNIKYKTFKALLWVGIGSIVMLFAALTSAYIVRQAEGRWLHFELPQVFWFSTAIILASSITLNWAVYAVKKDKLKIAKSMLFLTLALGLAFVFSQFAAWKTLVAENVFFTGKGSNASGSYLYVLSGLHLAHLFGGIIALIITFVNTVREKYNSKNLLGIQLCGIYWHFLDILWIYLFFFLLFIR